MGLFEGLKWQHPLPVFVVDNTGSISLAAKSAKYSRNMHINNHYHRARHLVVL